MRGLGSGSLLKVLVCSKLAPHLCLKPLMKASSKKGSTPDDSMLWRTTRRVELDAIAVFIPFSLQKVSISNLTHGIVHFSAKNFSN